ncbi:MAG: hypothetical protein NC820_06965 [Candidatus Omnitrophica bacterium]|nr:hypothetical protein [Candidatus Omnitrophota bacterium]
MKSEFISSVSHELRAPLTAIKGFSSLLSLDKFGNIPQEAKRKLKIIEENVDKLVDIVNTLLDISRIESRRLEIKIFPLDLVTLIKDVSELLMPQIVSKNLSFALDVPQELRVYMDRDLMERVLINIVNNAIKFTPSGGKILVKCETKDDLAIVIATHDLSIAQQTDRVVRLQDGMVVK